MAKVSKEELLQTKIGGRTLEEWDQGWEPVPNAYLKKQPHLRHSVGLFRTLLNGGIMYISRATEASGGIEKGLQRIRGKKQTGNSSYGAQMIRESFDQVEVEILRVEAKPLSVEVAKELKSAMVKLHNPEWHSAHKNRLYMLRTGNLPPK